jgi:hypothetical protein
MRKYTQMITELVRDNMGAFWSVLFISVGLTTLQTAITDWLSYSRLGTMLDGGLILRDIEPSTMDPTLFITFIKDFLIIMVLSLLIYAVLSSFTEGGFLSYLHRGKSEKNDYVSFFFSSALGKWGRMIVATIIQLLLIVITTIVIFVISSALTSFLTNSQNIDPVLVLFVILPILLGCLFVLISIVVFTWFITFESACTDGTFGEWVTNSFAKIKKVYWLMFLWIIVYYVIYYTLTKLGLYIGYYTHYIAIFVVNGIFILFTTYIFYPLYRLGTERHLNQLKINEDVRRLEERIWEEEQEKFIMD